MSTKELRAFTKQHYRLIVYELVIVEEEPYS